MIPTFITIALLFTLAYALFRACLCIAALRAEKQSALSRLVGEKQRRLHFQELAKSRQNTIDRQAAIIYQLSTDNLELEEVNVALMAGKQYRAATVAGGIVAAGLIAPKLLEVRERLAP